MIALGAPVVLSVPSAVIITVGVANHDFVLAGLGNPVGVLGLLVAAVCGALAFGALPAPTRSRAVAIGTVAVLAVVDLAVTLGLPLLTASSGASAAPISTAVSSIVAVLLAEVPLLLWLILCRRPPATWWVLVLPLAALVLAFALRSGLSALGIVAVLLVGTVVGTVLQQGAVLLGAVLAAAADPRPDA